MAARDPTLDTLLDLHGQVLVIDDSGYWVRFVVQSVPATREKPQGLDYSFTLHGPDGTRLAGFDNAHAVGRGRSGSHDHRHRLRTVRPYEYRDAGTLLADFWAEVEGVMRELGVWT